MISPESMLHQQKPIGKLQMPQLPGANPPSNQSNAFSGIRRAGQAKRAQNFEKWQGMKSGAQNGSFSDTSFQGAKNQSFGGLAGTQNGSMRQNKFQ